MVGAALMHGRRSSDARYGTREGGHGFDQTCGPLSSQLGGRLGLHKRLWQAGEFSDEISTGVELTYVSPTGEEVGQLFILKT